MAMTQLLTPAADASADGPDAVILAAFARRRDALRAVAALTEQPEFGKVTAEEHDLIAVADQAEQEILDTMALTPEGVAAKIWVAMHHEAEGSGPDTWAMVDSDLPGREPWPEDRVGRAHLRQTWTASWIDCQTSAAPHLRS